MSCSSLMRKAIALGFLAAFATIPATAALAQAAYPIKPVRLIVPFAAGGPNDVMARVLAQRMSIDNGQAVVVDNKAGAGGVIGTDAVAKSSPDGYTLGFVSAPFTMTPALQAKMPYDSLRDLIAISKVAESPLVLMVPSTSPYKSAGELLAFARQNPGKLTYGTGGIGSTPHLSTELLGSVAGAKFLHVPYKGGGESIKALMGGEIDLLLDSITSTTGPLASGRIKALAVGGASRSACLPDVPTLAEAGVQNFAVTHWVGVIAPAKMPPALVATLHAQIVKALHAPEVMQKLQELGASPVGDSPAEFQRFTEEEIKRWGQVVKAANIQAQ
jgi:tripartite-type tricarboxylate transporter receptor subunit TctC